MRPDVSPPVPLRLSLEPVLPTRTPSYEGCFVYGFRLRLPDGPEVDRSDPLLVAYGARIVTVAIHDDDEESVQDDAFDPGSLVRLLPESGGADEAEVGVWDPEGLRRGGSLLDRAAAIVGAAVECGLAQSALVLTEDRSAEDDRREGLDLLVFHRAFVDVDASAAASFRRPVRSARARLVLVADGSGDVRWWDPSADAGPIAADDLPMSADLTSAMQRLRAAYAELANDDASERRGFERFEAALDRHALDEQAAALWKRARAELGRRFAIGFLGAGMERPVWSPDELDDDDESDIPF